MHPYLTPLPLSLSPEFPCPCLFSPIELGGMHFPNRIAVAPMCQYSADDGSATDWHLQHWMNLAMSGAGMVTVEATDVERRGRITHGCLGLYSDDNEAAAARTLAAARRVARPGTRFGIQLAHAGRKASVHRPWQGGAPLGTGDDPWQTVAPSAIAYRRRLACARGARPRRDRRDHGRLRRGGRARRAGRLRLSSRSTAPTAICSTSSCRRSPTGATTTMAARSTNRMRFLLEVARAVRAALPPAMIVGARLSGSDWVEGGFNPDEAVVVARALQAMRASPIVCASSGGMSPSQKVPSCRATRCRLPNASGARPAFRRAPSA